MACDMNQPMPQMLKNQECRRALNEKLERVLGVNSGRPLPQTVPMGEVLQRLDDQGRGSLADEGKLRRPGESFFETGADKRTEWMVKIWGARAP